MWEKWQFASFSSTHVHVFVCCVFEFPVGVMSSFWICKIFLQNSGRIRTFVETHYTLRVRASSKWVRSSRDLARGIFPLFLFECKLSNSPCLWCLLWFNSMLDTFQFHFLLIIRKDFVYKVFLFFLQTSSTRFGECWFSCGNNITEPCTRVNANKIISA